MSKKGVWLTSIFALLLASSAIAHSIQMTPARVVSQPHHWRLIFNTSSLIHYHAFTLKNPNRIVIDLDNGVFTRAIKQTELINTPVMRIRYGHPSHQVTRMVLDLNYPVNATIYVLSRTLHQPDRLVIDLKGRQQPVLAFSWPGHSDKASHSKPLESPIENHKKKIIEKRIKRYQRSRDVIIVIDPGHGGKDPGATGRFGTHEKNTVLAISKQLKKLINQQPGFKAYLTRHGDYYLTLRERLAIARKDKADMFVAIHADAWRNQTASGASVFALSQRGATSEAARWLAARENQSELMGGVKLSNKTDLLKSVLINLSQTATIRASLSIGKDMINALRKITHLHHSRVEQAAFVVLKSPDIPSLLVETGFLSNPYEERRLANWNYRYHLAMALMQGIVRYFSLQPPRGSWLAIKKYHPELLRDRRFLHYHVERGDTLMALSEHFRVSMRAIKRMNHLKSNELFVGEKLIIPHIREK